MSIIKTIAPQYNFWELYPDLEKVEEFASIKTYYKKESSDVMWFIVNCFDSESKFINLYIDDRTELLSKDMMKDITWYNKNGNRIQPAVDMYIRLNDTPAKRHMRQWTETLEKRTIFLKNAEYDLDNYDKLDKMAVNTKALMDTFKKIQEELTKENGVITRGGAQPSLADGGEI